MKVGDTLYLKPMGNRARGGNKEIREAKIIAIGRKFIKTDFVYGEFHIDTMLQKTKYSVDYKAYTSKQEIIDEDELDGKKNKIWEFFRYQGTKALTIEQADKIIETLNLK